MTFDPVTNMELLQPLIDTAVKYGAIAKTFPAGELRLPALSAGSR